ncbi:uncharacterized protein LOC142059706 isoform X2 [Phalacrocorax aristotelis]|uniref:uncharacterized protein LOC142059706 isoform X2 n=1 Tax=Phalacrocorax aristotelis TaxID=126867 RepID=UPI003F4B9C71
MAPRGPPRPIGSGPPPPAPIGFPAAGSRARSAPPRSRQAPPPPGGSGAGSGRSLCFSTPAPSSRGGRQRRARRGWWGPLRSGAGSPGAGRAVLPPACRSSLGIHSAGSSCTASPWSSGIILISHIHQDCCDLNTSPPFLPTASLFPLDPGCQRTGKGKDFQATKARSRLRGVRSTGRRQLQITELMRGFRRGSPFPSCK